jgi:transcriptional regulator with PAS, ATPase and Fis domain
MTEAAPSWWNEIDAAVTVTDATGVIVAMNARSQETFARQGGARLIGRHVQDCHPRAIRTQIDAFLRDATPNHYTLRKAGQRKIVHQLPWFEGGVFAGMVEITVPIPEELPHRERS